MAKRTDIKSILIIGVAYIISGFIIAYMISAFFILLKSYAGPANVDTISSSSLSVIIGGSIAILYGLFIRKENKPALKRSQSYVSSGITFVISGLWLQTFLSYPEFLKILYAIRVSQGL